MSLSEKAITLKSLEDREILLKVLKNGFPERERATMWKILSGYLPLEESLQSAMQKMKKTEYLNLVHYHFNVTQERYKLAWESVKEQINKDMPRTFIDPFKIFKSVDFQTVCFITFCT